MEEPLMLENLILCPNNEASVSNKNTQVMGVPFTPDNWAVLQNYAADGQENSVLTEDGQVIALPFAVSELAAVNEEVVQEEELYVVQEQVQDQWPRVLAPLVLVHVDKEEAGSVIALQQPSSDASTPYFMEEVQHSVADYVHTSNHSPEEVNREISDSLIYYSYPDAALPCNAESDSSPSLIGGETFENSYFESSHKNSDHHILCEECGKGFDNLDSYFMHQKIHSGEQLYKCKHCAKLFSQNCQLERHLKIHSGESFTRDNGDRSVGTHVAGYTTVELCRYEEVEPEEDGGFILPDDIREEVHDSGCGTLSPDVADIADDSGSVDKSNRDKTFTLARQSSSQHTFQLSGHMCVMCFKTFTHEDKLNEHKCLKKRKMPYQCLNCLMWFADSGPYSVHKRHCVTLKDVVDGSTDKASDVHPLPRAVPGGFLGQGPFQCDVCKICFKTKSVFKQHKRLHRGPGPHKCNVCKIFFNSKNVLIQHKCIDTGQEPYPCDVCKMGFSCKTSLIQHKRIHRAEKPFQCAKCQKCFSHCGVLQRHMRDSCPFQGIDQSAVLQEAPAESSHLVIDHQLADTVIEDFQGLCRSAVLQEAPEESSHLVIDHQLANTGIEDFQGLGQSVVLQEAPEERSRLEIDHQLVNTAIEDHQETEALNQDPLAPDPIVKVEKHVYEEHEESTNLHMEVDIKEEDMEGGVKNCEMEDCHVKENKMEEALQILQDTAYLSDYDSDGNIAVPAAWDNSEEEDFKEGLHSKVLMQEKNMMEGENWSCETGRALLSVKTEALLCSDTEKTVLLRNEQMHTDAQMHAHPASESVKDMEEEPDETEISRPLFVDCEGAALEEESQHSNEEIGSRTTSTSEPLLEAVHIQSPFESPSTEQEEASVQVNEVTACHMGQPTRQKRRKQIIKPREDIIEELPEEMSPEPMLHRYKGRYKPRHRRRRKHVTVPDLDDSSDDLSTEQETPTDQTYNAEVDEEEVKKEGEERISEAQQTLLPAPAPFIKTEALDCNNGDKDQCQSVVVKKEPEETEIRNDMSEREVTVPEIEDHMANNESSCRSEKRRRKQIIKPRLDSETQSKKNEEASASAGHVSFVAMCGELISELTDTRSTLEQMPACANCGEVIEDMSIDSDDDLDDLVCRGCSKYLALGENLDISLKVAKRSSSARPFQCGVCGGSFCDMFSLDAHLQEHVDKDVYACAWCAATFGRKASLAAHAKTHAGKHPYRYRMCRKRFAPSAGLNMRHVEHSDEESFA